ncbi:DNA topoisomerase 3-alpha-like [Cotesia glomerata]|nr:DNA topoisomerase 3-alpha-like [Cotesia glomerata]
MSTIDSTENRRIKMSSFNYKCKCNEPAKKTIVRKEGPNKGRAFHACAKKLGNSCKFFRWADKKSASKSEHDNLEENLQASKINVNEGNLICVCGELACKFVVKKEGANKGRSFYGCSRGQESACEFFQWANIDVAARKQPSAVQQPSENNLEWEWDEDEDWDRDRGDDQNRLDDQYTSGTLNSVGNQVRCICGQLARLQTVEKDGANKGREFYTCSKESPKSCGFFDWAQDYSTRSAGSIPAKKKPAQPKKKLGDKKYGSLF